MPFSLVRPASVAEAVAALSGPGRALPIAGGTDLLLDLEAGRLMADRVVSLARLPWAGLEERGDQLVIGSTLPLRSLERRAGLADDLPGLFDAVRSVGSASLRRRATLGGNLARAAPASDLLPILLALDAGVRIVGPSGPRSVPIDRFVRASRSVDLAPGELIESVEVPRRARCAYAWQRVRPSNDISQVGVAVARPPGADAWSVALGGVVPRPIRVRSAETELSADDPPADARARAAQVVAREAPFTTDRRASAEYRRRLVGVLVERALERAVDRGGRE